METLVMNKPKTNYKLYKGFKLIGEFTDIYSAKFFAKSQGKGAYNLKGDNYLDQWYQFN